MKKDNNKKEKEKIKPNENEKELKNEKEYLIDREHNTSKEKNNKKESEQLSINDQSKQLNEDKEQNDMLNDMQEEEKPKKMIEIKPRENYLKDKIHKLNFNNIVLSGINRGIDEQLKSVKRDIISKKVLLKDTPKSVEKYINKSFELGYKINDDNYNVKNKHKAIKELKIEKDNLNRKLVQLTENENLLENKGGSELLVEQNLKEKLKKDVNNQKNKIAKKKSKKG